MRLIALDPRVMEGSVSSVDVHGLITKYNYSQLDVLMINPPPKS